MTDAELASFLASGAQTYGKSAYMLVYERKSKKNLREIGVKSAKESEKKADADSQQIVEGANEEAKQVDFRTVPRYVPEWIKKEVLEDNKNFLIDAQMFHDDFFDHIKALFK